MQYSLVSSNWCLKFLLLIHIIQILKEIRRKQRTSCSLRKCFSEKAWLICFNFLLTADLFANSWCRRSIFSKICSASYTSQWNTRSFPSNDLTDSTHEAFHCRNIKLQGYKLPHLLWCSVWTRTVVCVYLTSPARRYSNLAAFPLALMAST
jgi:hypothetical protein